MNLLRFHARRPDWALWFAASLVASLGWPAYAVAPVAPVAANCIVECREGGCKVSGRELDKAPEKIPACASATLNDGVVHGVFQGKNGLERFKISAPPATVFRDKVKALASATCLVGSLCLEERELRRVPGTGGKGADEDTFVHEGRPCELGLPCGLLLRPKQSLLIEVSSFASGKFVLEAKRGASKASATFDLRDGRIELPADALVAGAVYKYTLRSSSGDATARGEFSVMSTKMQNDIEKAIADVKRTQPEQSALGEVEILIEEDLQWDAAQRLK